MTTDPNAPDIGFIGFGEAARAIVEGWGAERPARVSAYDLKLDDETAVPAMASAANAAGVRLSASCADLVQRSELVFCLVTADQAAVAAQAAAAFLRPGTIWLDGNSCAPGTKKRAAAAIEGAGGRYVDLAIMAPILPRRHRTPMLVAGPHATNAATLLRAFGMDVEIAGDEVGAASAIKMIRSVMIKGMEALTAECLLAARQAGVEEQVLASFEASEPNIAWRKRSLYNLGRMSEHGIRRAAEMREVALTLRELGMPDRMAEAIASWQDQVGSLRLGALADDLVPALDQTLAALGR